MLQQKLILFLLFLCTAFISGSCEPPHPCDYKPSLSPINCTMGDKPDGSWELQYETNKSVSENGTTDTFIIWLNWREPDTTVYVDVTSSDTSEVAVSPATISWEPSEYKSSRTVTLTGVDDNIDDGDVTSTITLDMRSGDPSYNALSNLSTTVVTTDDEEPGFTIAVTDNTTNEAGATGQATAVLDIAPTSNVVLDVTSSDTTEATVSPSSLTFTTGNWNTAQTVTVTGADDNLVDGDIVSTITFAVNDGSSADEYDPLANQTFTVSTEDDDVVGFTITETGSTVVSETGTTDTFTVRLNTQPTGNVVFNLTDNDADDSEITYTPTTLTFTTGNWNTAQTVTITGRDDSDLDGTITSTITVAINTGSTADTDYDAVAAKTVSVNTLNDDVATVVVAASGGNTTVNEAGSTDTYTVALSVQPTAAVVLNVVSRDTTESTVSPASLSFDASNWNTPQTVTATGANDNIADNTVTHSHRISPNTSSTLDSNYDVMANYDVTVATTDDDNAGILITETGGNTTVNESGTTDTVTITLTSEPLYGNVRVTSNTNTGLSASEFTYTPTMLTFTSSNWNTPQTVTVTSVDDNEVDGDQTLVVRFYINTWSTDPPEYDISTIDDNLTIVIVDDDNNPSFSITETGGSTSVDESGTTDTFTVVLGTAPSGNVVFDLTDNDTDNSEISYTPTSLTFTTGNWNTAQTVTVTGQNEVIDDGNQTSSITVAVNTGSTADAGYDALASKSVSVTTVDNDLAGMTASPSGGSTAVSETGTTDTITVVLDTLPASNVVVDVTASDTTEATVSPSSLTFTTGNWNSAQTVTVTGVDDDVADGNITTIVTLAINDGSSSDEYDPVSNITLSVSTADDDEAKLQFRHAGSDGTNTTVSENGTTDTMMLRLASEPTANVVVNLASTDTTEFTLSPSSATYTPSNWNSFQYITVTPVDDNIIDGTISAYANAVIDTAGTLDSAYDSATTVGKPVSIEDDDVAYSKLTAGEYHYCLERGTDNTVWCWGQGQHGKLGNNDTANQSSPVQMQGVSNVTSIQLGSDKSCVLMSGEIECVGLIYEGNGNNRQTHMTIQGMNSDLGMGLSGSITVWGAGRQDFLAWNGTEARAIGKNVAGEHGVGDFNNNKSPENPNWQNTAGSALIPSAILIPGNTERNNNCIVEASTNKLFCMGDAAEDFYSDLSGISGNQASPVEMTHVGTTWKDFSMGNKSSCFIDASNEVYCYGSDQYERLGNGSGQSASSTPVKININKTFRKVAQGDSHACAITNDSAKDLYCWGGGGGGKIGNGTIAHQGTPQLITTGVAEVALGIDSTCVIHDNATVQCWGVNTYGQLGDPSVSSRSTPGPVTIP